jgi:hypothetical protein
MENNYTSPLAKWSRILEIFIPAYMFGKSWGIADEKTVDLFRAEFPPFLIDAAQLLKRIIATDNENLQRLVATCAGALVGFLIICLFAAAMHYILGDRKYIDSLRFTSVTLIPIAVLNGTLSHVLKTILEGLGVQSTEALTQSALQSPWGYFVLNVCFYFTALWMLGKRTGVKRARRFGVVGAGIAFMVIYIACGLMITPGEWNELLPKLQQSMAH